MRFLISALAAAALGAGVLGPVAAQADTAKDYNLFVLGNMNMHSSDVEGRVAVGGNAALSSYSVGALASPSTVNLVVGGNLTANGGSTVGKTIVAGMATYTNWSNANLQPVGTPLPVNFSTEGARLVSLSTALDAYVANGTVASPWGGQFTLTGTNAGLNVFDLNGAALAGANTMVINLVAGSTALINVSGTADSFSNAGITIHGGDASSILWNFSDATTLSFSGINMQGSVLAPNADYLGGWGQLNGQLIVKNFTDAKGATQINNIVFKGDLLGLNPAAIPEPATWAMMILGFGAVGGLLRRKRGVALAA